MKRWLVIPILSALVAACATSPPRPMAQAPLAEPVVEPARPVTPLNLAYGKPSRSNNHIYEFTADKAFDGEPLSYWEGGANVYPNDLQVDLRAPQTVRLMVVKLNPKRIWQTRQQTFEVLASDDGLVWQSVVPSAVYTFDPDEGGNLVRIDVEATHEYWMLRFTANTEANAGQVAEWELYADPS